MQKRSAAAPLIIAGTLAILAGFMWDVPPIGHFALGAALTLTIIGVHNYVHHK